MRFHKELLPALYVAGIVGASEYHVDPNGTGDFTTIAAAADVLQPGDVCVVHEGTYRETVSPARSGNVSQPITFRANTGEVVTVSGCTRVTSPWSVHSGSIYRTQISGYMAPGRNMVFMDGKALVEARFPNTTWSPTATISPLWPTTVGFSVPGSGYDGGTRVSSPELAGKPTDYFKGAIYRGRNGWAWSQQTAYVESSGDGYIDIVNPSATWWFGGDGEGMLSGTLTLLDNEGEWCISEDYLYVWLPGNADPADHTIEFKSRYLAFDLRDREYVDIDGIDAFSASATLDSASNCSIRNCTLDYVCHYEWFNDGRDGYIDAGSSSADGPSGQAPGRGEVGLFLGGHDNTLDGCTIRYSSGAGVYLCGRNNTVTQCTIREAGYAGTYVSGIFISYDGRYASDPATRGGHRIVANAISQTGRACVHWTSGLGSTTEYTQYLPSVVIYNDMSSAMLLSDDGGLLYGWNVGGNGTVVAYNWFHDNRATVSAAGVYLDDGCTDFIVHHNAVWDCPEGMRIGHIHPSSGHRIYNNTFWSTSAAMGEHGDGAFTDMICRNNVSGHADYRGTTLSDNLTLALQDAAFIDAAGGDLRIGSGSACIDAGAIIAGYTEGYAGVGPDAGAYEYQGSPALSSWTAGVGVVVHFADGVPEAIEGYPTARITLDKTTGNAPLTVQAGADSSDDSDGEIVSYLWDFGDGQSGTGVTVAHTYNDGGRYTIALTVTDDSGLMAQSREVVDVLLAGEFWIRAIDYTDAMGIVADDLVGSCDNGDWVMYAGIDLTDVVECVARVGVSADYAGQQAEFRLGSTGGQLIGTLTVQSTGGFDVMQEQSISISPVTGTHDLYVVFKGSYGVGNFEAFGFRPPSSIIRPPTPPTGAGSGRAINEVYDIRGRSVPRMTDLTALRRDAATGVYIVKPLSPSGKISTAVAGLR